MRQVAGAPLVVADETLGKILFERAERIPEGSAFQYRRGDGFATLTWHEVATAAEEVAAGLLSFGLQPGDRVAVVSETRHEWALADLGVLAAGGVTVTVYPTLPPDQIAHLLKDSGARYAFVEQATQGPKLPALAQSDAKVERWITLEAKPDDTGGVDLLGLDGLREAGRAFLRDRPGAVRERVEASTADDPSTIIYTSGTTGVPKGAVLTHRNCVAASRSSIEAFHLDRLDEVSIVLYLPLAHTLTRFALLTGMDLGGRVVFSSPRALAEDLRAVQPTLTVNVPRIYERMYDQIRKAVAEAPAARQRIFARAEATAHAYGRALANGGRPGLGLRARHALYERLVYRPLRERLGFSRVRLGFSGSAAIRPELLHFFQGIGARIVEAWGMTETSTPGTVNPPDRFKPGTVGLPFPGVRIALDDEGEVLVAGPNVFSGYHGMPEETAASFVELDGVRWFRTGDIGEMDADGYLRIVDRKKEIEVLDTGKKVAPVVVEEALKASPLIAEAFVVGTGHKHLAALVQPDFDALVQLARKKGLPHDASRVVVQPDPTGQPMTYAVGADLLGHPDVRALFEAEIVQANRRLADFERVKAFDLVPHAFTMARDELTPTLKKKRRTIREHYAREIDALFEGPRIGEGGR